MPDLVALADRYPWLLVVIVAIVVLRAIGEALASGSEGWARALGPLGARWRSRGERRRRRESAELDESRRREAADLADLRRQVEYLAPRVESLTAHSELVDDYLVYDAAWHARHERWAAESAIALPPPPHLTFAEFKEQRSRDRSTP